MRKFVKCHWGVLVSLILLFLVIGILVGLFASFNENEEMTLCDCQSVSQCSKIGCEECPSVNCTKKVKMMKEELKNIYEIVNN